MSESENTSPQRNIHNWSENYQVPFGEEGLLVLTFPPGDRMENESCTSLSIAIKGRQKQHACGKEIRELLVRNEFIMNP